MNAVVTLPLGMNANPARVRATAFHTRAADANEANDWQTRAGFTLARSYAGCTDEALAGRFRAGLIDLSWRWRVMLEGARVSEFLARLVTADPGTLMPGQALKALWLSDGGAVRGAGVIARHGKERFVIAAAAEDMDWIEIAAARFEVTTRDITEDEGGLGLVGPYATATLARAGLAVDVEPLAFKKQFWRGLDVTLSRFGEQGGFEIWCAADDGVLVWDRLMRAGAPFGIEPIGLAAADVLDIEAGIARPERDLDLARSGQDARPTPLALGLESLIQEAHTDFNGRTAWAAVRSRENLRMVGIEIDDDSAAPFTPLLRDGAKVGQTLSSVYSPALRRAIALAQVDAGAAVPGTDLTLTLCPDRGHPDFRQAAARVVELPFLPAPEQLAP